MKFFKPEDFYGYIVIADLANKKLEKESRIVIGSPETDWNEIGNKIETHKALLINIEPIEKCKHPMEKITLNGRDWFSFKCECGAKLMPTSFKEYGND